MKGWSGRKITNTTKMKPQRTGRTQQRTIRCFASFPKLAAASVFKGPEFAYWPALLGSCIGQFGAKEIVPRMNLTSQG
jgi:hypothetical protein